MKRDDKKALLSKSVVELEKLVHELTLKLLRSRQERVLQDRTAVNVRAPYHLRKQVAMIKTELHRRVLEPTA